ncbi:MAG: DUF861 domain-containing protein [Curvibacter sp.]|nr:DUF861 domain-containing protein [Curvibacter sp.]
MKNYIAAALGGALIAVAASKVLGLDSALHAWREPVAATEPQVQPLVPLSIDEGWVQSGHPNFRAVEIERSPESGVSAGLWACDGPSTFEWHFGTDETVHLLEGEVQVSYLGREFVLKPQDKATFWAGTRAIWRVPQHARKVFVLHDPGRLVRWWRHFFPPTEAG